MSISMKKLLHGVLIIVVMFVLTSCNDKDSECTPVRGAFQVPEKLNKNFTIPNFGGEDETGVVNPDGSYTVTTQHIGPINWTVQTIGRAMKKGTETIYKGLVGTADGGLGFGTIIKSCIVLSLMLFGVSVIMGLIQVNAYTTVLFVINILIVYYLATDWEVFNEFVIQNVESLVERLSNTMADVFSANDAAQTGGAAANGSRAVPSAATGSAPSVAVSGSSSSGAAAAPASAQDTFDSIEKMLQMFLIGPFWKLVIATLFSSWSGFMYFAVLAFLVYAYLAGIFFALHVYLIALIGRHLLYAIAPLYILFLLFQKTKSLFTAWIEQMVNFSLQPILLFAFLGMFNLMIVDFMTNQMVTSDDAYMCLKRWPPFIHLISLWQFNIGPKVQPSGVGSDVPLNFWSLIAVGILGWMMKDMAQWCVDTAGRLSGGLIPAVAPMKAWEAMKQSAKTSLGNRAKTGAAGLVAAPIGAAKRAATGAYAGARRGGRSETIGADGNVQKRGALQRAGGAVAGMATGLIGGAGRGIVSGAQAGAHQVGVGNAQRALNAHINMKESTALGGLSDNKKKELTKQFLKNYKKGEFEMSADNKTVVRKV